MTLSILTLAALIIDAVYFASPLCIFTLPIAAGIFGSIAFGSFMVGLFTGKSINNQERSVSDYIKRRDDALEVAHADKASKLQEAENEFNANIMVLMTTPPPNPSETHSANDLFFRSNPSSSKLSDAMTTERSTPSAADDSISNSESNCDDNSSRDYHLPHGR
jgi:hypothetical protein